MLDKLIEFLLDCIGFFRFCTVINAYEAGVVLRFGRHCRTIEAGFHWLIPFYVDSVIYDNVVVRTKAIEAQSLTTADGVNIVISVVVTAWIEDVEKALLEVEGVDDAIVDSCMGAVGQLVATWTWAELRSEEFSTKLTSAVRRNAKRYGVGIQQVQVADLAPCRVYRLHGEARH